MSSSRIVRLGFAAATLVTTVVLAAPASATIGDASLTGSGTISPGLTQSGYPGQTFTFSGTGVVASDNIQSIIECTWAGDDTIGSFSQGAGYFNGTCADSFTDTSTWSGPTWVSIRGSYARTGEVMTISAASTGGGLDGVWSGTCEWTPTSLDTNSLRLNSFLDSCNYTIQNSKTGAFALNGSSTFAPLTVQAGSPGTYTLNGSGVIATPDLQGTINCTLDFGTDTGSCTDAIGTVGITMWYVSTGAEIEVFGQAYGAGINGGFGGRCVFSPASEPEPDNYAVGCEFTVT